MLNPVSMLCFLYPSTYCQFCKQGWLKRSGACIDQKASQRHADMHARGTTVCSCSTGKELGRQSSKDKSRTKYGVSSMALLGWSDLRSGVAEHVPADCIHLGKHFSHLEQFNDHMQLSFADGESVDAKIAVGADGCFSKIRQHTLADGLPTFAVTLGALYSHISV